MQTVAASWDVTFLSCLALCFSVCFFAGPKYSCCFFFFFLLTVSQIPSQFVIRHGYYYFDLFVVVTKRELNARLLNHSMFQLQKLSLFCWHILFCHCFQGMLDFDYVCERKRPSVAAMVYPFRYHSCISWTLRLRP